MRGGLVLVLSFFVGSCGSGDENKSLLELNFRNKSPFFIESPTMSCVGFLLAQSSSDPPSPDIQARYFSMSKPVLSWKDPDRSLTVTMIRVRIQSASLGVDYDCGIFEDELSAAFGTSPTALWDRTLDPATKKGDTVTPTTRATQAACPVLKCGGFAPQNDVKASVPARLEVIGFSTDKNGDEFPVRFQTTFTVENDP